MFPITQKLVVHQNTAVDITKSRHQHSLSSTQAIDGDRGLLSLIIAAIEQICYWFLISFSFLSFSLSESTSQVLLKIFSSGHVSEESHLPLSTFYRSLYLRQYYTKQLNLFIFPSKTFLFNKKSGWKMDFILFDFVEKIEYERMEMKIKWTILLSRI